MRKTIAAKSWARTHSYVATFFLPVALLYAVTGGLYILGVHGTASRQSLQVVTEEALPEDLDALQSVVQSQLRDHQLPIPPGQAQVVRGRFVWGQPAGYSVTLETSKESNVATIHCQTPGLYSRLVMLHKAKCGTPFKALGITFAVAMTLIYLSGIVIAWHTASARKAFVATLACGTITTAFVVLLSM